MHIQVGYELIYDCPAPTPMALMLNVHHTHAADIIVPEGGYNQVAVDMLLTLIRSLAAPR